RHTRRAEVSLENPHQRSPLYRLGRQADPLRVQLPRLGDQPDGMLPTRQRDGAARRQAPQDPLRPTLLTVMDRSQSDPRASNHAHGERLSPYETSEVVAPVFGRIAMVLPPG